MRARKADIAIPKYVPEDRRVYYRLFFGIINKTFWLTQKLRPCGIGMSIFSTKELHKRNSFNEKLRWTDDMEYLKKTDKKRFCTLPTRVYFSVRRFEKEGTKDIMKKWLKSYWYFLNNRLYKTNKVRYFD
ncbi:hypothetical protein GF351_05500 [Candidatus Woesearchaeota archaeon]|nr:hypothetical protein [Candidatus Woesearchaeota archaeon]